MLLYIAVGYSYRSCMKKIYDCKSYHHNKDYYNIYIYIMGLRHCVFHSTFLHLSAFMYYFMSYFIKKSHYALSLYMYCISLMSTPCK